ncbi:MAG: hypothetical protein N2511_05635, partial [Thermodesulfovibrionales bacterium]|nr:hypothetical protein [Thermodesulfovibrionales bacterium]
RHNLFMPQMKLIYKQREGGKVVKTYGMDTPLNRALNLEIVSINTKEKLVKLRNTIDIVRLSEEIEELTEKLFIVYEKKLRRYENA